MAAVDSAIVIALWGAVLSTILAAVKLWEIWRDRFQLGVTYHFRSLADLGNDVIIRNLSSRPIILTHWELLYSSGRWPRRQFESIDSSEPDDGDQRIESHTTHILTFAYGRHFDWGHRALEGRQIWIRLFVAGRKPILKRVYRPLP